MIEIIALIIKTYSVGIIGTLILFATGNLALYTRKEERIEDPFILLVFSLIYPYTMYKLYKYMRMEE